MGTKPLVDRRPIKTSPVESRMARNDPSALLAAIMGSMGEKHAPVIKRSPTPLPCNTGRAALKQARCTSSIAYASWTGSWIPSRQSANSWCNETG